MCQQRFYDSCKVFGTSPVLSVSKRKIIFWYDVILYQLDAFSHSPTEGNAAILWCVSRFGLMMCLMPSIEWKYDVRYSAY